VSPLRGEKPQNWPLSKLNTGRFALRAMLPVNIKPVNGRPAATGIGAVGFVADTGGAAPVGAGIVRTTVATCRVATH